MKRICFGIIFVLYFIGFVSADDAETLPVLERDTIAPSVPIKIVRYATNLLQKNDKNADGVLQQNEWNGLIPNPQAADIDGDRIITLEELVWYLALFGKDKTIHRQVAPANDLGLKVDPANLKLFKPVPRASAPTETKQTSPISQAEQDAKKGDVSDKMLEEYSGVVDDAVYAEIVAGNQTPAAKRFYTLPEKLRGVPAWFLMRDSNGDGQVSLAEFAPTLSAAALALFGKLDKNGNGLIEPDEVRTKK